MNFFVWKHKWFVIANPEIMWYNFAATYYTKIVFLWNYDSLPLLHYNIFLQTKQCDCIYDKRVDECL